jgi:hypothetical protein
MKPKKESMVTTLARMRGAISLKPADPLEALAQDIRAEHAAVFEQFGFIVRL